MLVYILVSSQEHCGLCSRAASCWNYEYCHIKALIKLVRGQSTEVEVINL